MSLVAGQVAFVGVLESHACAGHVEAPAEDQHRLRAVGHRFVPVSRTGVVFAEVFIEEAYQGLQQPYHRVLFSHRGPDTSL